MPRQVNVPKFSRVAQLAQWGQAVARSLVAASIYDDKAEVRWFKRASEKAALFESLADVGDS
eukprot:10919799-Lingulodinium_polyedra.AAC.1